MDKLPVAIVTGGAQGLGAAIVEVLLKKGYKVCVSDIQEEKGEEFVKLLALIYETKSAAKGLRFMPCDVSKEEDYKKLFDFALNEFGCIDLVVNNAGILLEQNPRKCIDVNLMGPIIGCQLAMKYMGKSNGGRGGMVINTASLAGFTPFDACPVYCATKHGVIGLTRSYGLPYHLEKDGVIFTALCPGFSDTEIVDKFLTDSLIEGLDPRKSFPIMNPNYVAEAVKKLLEDKINGSTLTVTLKGGYQYMKLPEEVKTLLD